MTDHQSDLELTDRLRSIGRQPVDEAVQQSHRRRIDAMGDAAAIPRRRRFGPLSVAAVGILGFAVGSTGLAMAGALPDTAQDVAHDVLGVVKVDVPAGKEGKRGPCVSEAAKIKDKDAKQAAKDACPKGPVGDDDGSPGRSGDAPGKSGDAPGKSGDAPGKSGDAPGKSGDAPKGNTKHDDDPCKGKPPWAGPMSKEDREAAKAANSRDACVDDDLDDDLGDDDDSTVGG